MRLTVFFHAWVDGAWSTPTSEFCEALGDFDGPRYTGVVGIMSNYCRYTTLRPEFEVVACEREGFESVTLNCIRDYAQHIDGAVLYAHTKGAATVDPFRDRWRRSMLNRVVVPWRENLALLEDHDAVGTHWLTEEGFPGMFGPLTVPAEGSGFFGGNFWMARCDYLRKLPECPASPRWQAESWIGWGKPRVVDLLPGWPHDNRWPELCG